MATEAPPSYEASNIGAPPRYEHLFPMQEIRCEMHQAKTEGGQNAVTLPLKLCGLLCSSIACGICVLLLSILPIIMIVIGSIYLNDCDLERMIPIFLIVFGVVSLCQTCTHLGSMCALRKKQDDTDRERGRSGASCCSTLISLFLFIWIIVGSYYVFYNWNIWIDAGKPSCSVESPSTDCCESEVMYTAFTVLIFMYFLGITFCIAAFCFLCCMACFSLAA